jgi:deoxyribose-phosphate aldolase
MNTTFNKKDLAQYIDHTLLKSESTVSDFDKLCSEAIQNQLYAVCVPGRFVKHCRTQLVNSSVKLACVVGFPHGNQSPKSKAFEASLAVSDGADELDMVISIGAIKEKNWEFVTEDIKCVVQAASGKIVKVIFETHLLNQDEKARAVECSIQAGAHFIKTSTGFNGGGATLEDITLMKKVANGRIQIKASGGIKTFEQAVSFIQAGAHRLGTSSGVALINHQSATGTY